MNISLWLLFHLPAWWLVHAFYTQQRVIVQRLADSSVSASPSGSDFRPAAYSRTCACSLSAWLASDLLGVPSLLSRSRAALSICRTRHTPPAASLPTLAGSPGPAPFTICQIASRREIKRDTSPLSTRGNRLKIHPGVADPDVYGLQPAIVYFPRVLRLLHDVAPNVHRRGLRITRLDGQSTRGQRPHPPFPLVYGSKSLPAPFVVPPVWTWMTRHTSTITQLHTP